MSANPNLAGPVSPTPPDVYEPRLFSVRIWLPDVTLRHGIGAAVAPGMSTLAEDRFRRVRLAGIGFFFKAPYGQAMNAATVLARACSRRQILRFTFGPASKRQLTRINRAELRRFEDIFETVAHEWRLDWAA